MDLRRTTIHPGRCGSVRKTTITSSPPDETRVRRRDQVSRHRSPVPVYHVTGEESSIPVSKNVIYSDTLHGAP